MALNDVLVKSQGFRMMDIEAKANGSTIDKFSRMAWLLLPRLVPPAILYGRRASGITSGQRYDSQPHLSSSTPWPVLHLPEDEVINLEFGDREKDIMVTFDGQTTVSITPKDAVKIKKATYCTRLIRLNQMSSYDRLRIKLSSEY